jgi:uncharacterized membrane protein
MKTNESNLDRVIRVIAGLALLVLFFANVIGGTLGIVLAVIGGILVITGAVGFCPLYALLKLRTNKS